MPKFCLTEVYIMKEKIKLADMPDHVAIYALWAINRDTVRIAKQNERTVILSSVPPEQLNCPEGLGFDGSGCYTNKYGTKKAYFAIRVRDLKGKPWNAKHVDDIKFV